MTTVKDTSQYARSCNPPRRAKRARHEDTTTPTVAPSTAPTQQRFHPHILPKDIPTTRTDVNHEPDSSDQGEDEYDPQATAPPPKRRGRKPGTMSRSARESQRKLNHSRIEKARRTKINETLTTLSALVSDAEKQKSTLAGAPTADSQATKSKAKTEEKEFKLDVLVKAVTYMQDLIAKVKTLESKQCSHCKSGVSRSDSTATSGVKRKRNAGENDENIGADAGDVDDVYVGDDEKGAGDDQDEDEEPRAHPSSRLSSVRPSPSPRLPSIASWLPHPYVDPSCIAAMADANNALPPSHLPSPPMSGTFRSSASFSAQSLPSLTLPGPARPLPPSAQVMPAPVSQETLQTQTTSIRPGKRTSQASMPRPPRMPASPSISPTWTPEDETAASMLLQMSSSPRSTSTTSSMPVSTMKLPRSAEVPPSPPNRTQATPSSVLVQVQTPSSMLGM